MPNRTALYLRVSTGEQTTENQRRELEAVAERSGWGIVAVYEDAGISGAKGRDKRPGLNRLMKDATRRKFDRVAVWSVDRLGRSLQDLVAFMNEMHELGVALYLHQQAIDTRTPSGKMLFQMSGVFAEFERAMIQERVKSGLARVKAEGRTWTAAARAGRAKGPSGRPPLADGTRKAIQEAKAAGLSVRVIAAQCGVSPTTVQAVTRALDA